MSSLTGLLDSPEWVVKVILVVSVRKMPKNKNKPKKNAAADAPVEQESGTTEVIAGPGFVAPADAAPAVPADVAPVAPVAPADAAPVAPADAAPVAPVSADKTADTTDVSTKPTTSEVYKDFTEAPASVAATAAIEPAPAAIVPATTTQPAETTQAPKGGFLNYLRSFFYDIGGAIHR